MRQGILDRLEQRASKGGQWFLSNPDSFALQMFGGHSSASGLVIDADAAMEWTALAAAIRILSNTFGMLPLHVYRRLDRGRERVTDHSLSTLLQRAPNPEQTAMEWRSLIPIHAILWGNSYSEIVRRGGVVREIWPLNPDRVKQKRSSSGTLFYELTLPDGGKRTLTRDQVLHVPGFVTNGLVGRALLKDHEEAIGLGLATELYSARFFGNDASPGGILQHPETLSEEALERLRTTWENRHSGTGGAYRLAILEEGLEWKQVTVDPEKADALGLRQFQTTEATRIVTGVPPHLIGNLDRATFSNIEQQAIEFVTYGLQPWVVKAEQRIWLSLFTEAERDSGLYAEHVVEGILRGDSESRAAFYTALFNLGALTPNEIRERENLNPVDGGDETFVRLDVTTLDLATDPPEPLPLPPSPSPPPSQASSSAAGELRDRTGYERRAREAVISDFEQLFSSFAERLTRREINRIRRALKTLESGDEESWQNFLVRYYFETLPAEIVALARPLFRAYALAFARVAAAERNGEPDPEATREFADEYTETFAKRHSKSSRTQLEKLSTDEREPAATVAAIEGRLTEWEEGTKDGRPRAERIADRETRQLGNSVALQTLTALGATRFVWRTFGKNCPTCRALSGRVVGVGEPFLGEGEDFKAGDMPAPYKPSSKIAHPPLHAGCDCAITEE